MCIRDRDMGLWARAFSEADGDEKKAQARYIGLRATHLISDERRKQEAAQLNAKQQQLSANSTIRSTFEDVARLRVFGNTRGRLIVLKDKFVFDSPDEEVELLFEEIDDIIRLRDETLIEMSDGQQFEFEGASLCGMSPEQLLGIAGKPAN